MIPLVERMDYLAYYFNAMAFCMSVERLLDEPVPERAQYLRVIHCELNRIHSHLVWLGTTALDLGAISIFWYCFRERDKVLDLFEFSSGQRMHTRYIQVGGVVDDIPAGWAEKALRFTEDMEERVGQYEAILDRNEIFLQRTKDVGIVPQERLLDLGVTGPLLRAAGNPWDLRKAAPYSSYDKFDFKIPVGTVGDCYDRYRVRVAEIRESCSIIRQAIEGLPEGPYITTNRKVALPPRHELATSMEALIHHFKLVTEGFRVPPGEAYVPIESPRGEMGCFVLADGSAKPARVHMRDPSFVNLQALREMVVGGYIADMITNLAMLDPILGGIDTSEQVRSPARQCPARAAGWLRRSGRARGSRPTRRTVPEPQRRGRARGAARDDRAPHVPVSGPPFGGPARAGGRAARARLAVAGGDAAGGGGDAVQPRVPRVGRELLRHARAGARRQPHHLHVHEPVVPDARRAGRARRAVRGDRLAGRRVEPRRRVPPALVRVPRRLRHRADGVDRGPLPRPADSRRRADDRGSPARRRARSEVLPEKADVGVPREKADRR